MSENAAEISMPTPKAISKTPSAPAGNPIEAATKSNPITRFLEKHRPQEGQDQKELKQLESLQIKTKPEQSKIDQLSQAKVNTETQTNSITQDPAFKDTVAIIKLRTDLSREVIAAKNTHDQKDHPEVKDAIERTKFKVIGAEWSKFAEKNPDKIDQIIALDPSIKTAMDSYKAEQARLSEMKTGTLIDAPVVLPRNTPIPEQPEISAPIMAGGPPLPGELSTATDPKTPTEPITSNRHTIKGPDGKFISEKEAARRIGLLDQSPTPKTSDEKVSLDSRKAAFATIEADLRKTEAEYEALIKSGASKDVIKEKESELEGKDQWRIFYRDNILTPKTGEKPEDGTVAIDQAPPTSKVSDETPTPNESDQPTNPANNEPVKEGDDTPAETSPDSESTTTSESETATEDATKAGAEKSADDSEATTKPEDTAEEPIDLLAKELNATKEELAKTKEALEVIAKRVIENEADPKKKKSLIKLLLELGLVLAGAGAAELAVDAKDTVKQPG